MTTGTWAGEPGTSTVVEPDGVEVTADLPAWLDDRAPTGRLRAG
ncbi:MAG: hypothetical protein ACYCTE_11075 [Acidimicrobiales bacterium]